MALTRLMGKGGATWAAGINDGSQAPNLISTSSVGSMLNGDGDGSKEMVIRNADRASVTHQGEEYEFLESENFVINEDFSESTNGWDSRRGNGTVSVVGDRLRITTTDAENTAVSKVLTGLEVGAVYKLKFSAYLGTMGEMHFRVWNSLALDASGPYTTWITEDRVDFEATFIAEATTHYIGLVVVSFGNAGRYSELSDISVTKGSVLAPYAYWRSDGLNDIARAPTNVLFGKPDGTTRTYLLRSKLLPGVSYAGRKMSWDTGASGGSIRPYTDENSHGAYMRDEVIVYLNSTDIIVLDNITVTEAVVIAPTYMEYFIDGVSVKKVDVDSRPYVERSLTIGDQTNTGQAQKMEWYASGVSSKALSGPEQIAWSRRMDRVNNRKANS